MTDITTSEWLARLRVLADDPERFAAERKALVQREIACRYVKCGINSQSFQDQIDMTRAVAGTPRRACEQLNGLMEDRLEVLAMALEELRVYCRDALSRSRALHLERETRLLEELAAMIESSAAACHLGNTSNNL